MGLGRHGAIEPIAVRGVRAESSVEWRSIHIALVGMERVFSLFYSSDDTDESERKSATPDWAFLIEELFKSSTKWYTTEVFELIHS